MEELVRHELVIIDDPLRIGQMLPECVTVRAVHRLRLGEIAVVQIEQQEVADDFDPWDDVALAGTGIQGESGLGHFGGRWRGSGGGRLRRGCGDDGGVLSKACSRCYEPERQRTTKKRDSELSCMREYAHARCVPRPHLGACSFRRTSPAPFPKHGSYASTF